MSYTGLEGKTLTWLNSGPPRTPAEIDRVADELNVRYVRHYINFQRYTRRYRRIKERLERGRTTRVLDAPGRRAGA